MRVMGGTLQDESSIELLASGEVNSEFYQRYHAKMTESGVRELEMTKALHGRVSRWVKRVMSHGNRPVSLERLTEMVNDMPVEQRRLFAESILSSSIDTEQLA